MMDMAVPPPVTDELIQFDAAEWEVQRLCQVITRFGGQVSDEEQQMMYKLGTADRSNFAMNIMKRDRLRTPFLDGLQLERWLAYRRASIIAQMSYVPRLYPSRITLLRASNEQPDPFGYPSGIRSNPTLGWNALSSKPVEVHEIPGDHDTMTSEPHVRSLAERLRQCLLAAS
jgi:thioesterase domain-containing protein